jgi:hypothetical protein
VLHKADTQLVFIDEALTDKALRCTAIQDAMWSTFFCAVCRVIGILKALGFGRIALLDIAHAKAVLLGLGKNPGGLVDGPMPPSLRRVVRGFGSSAI